MSNELIHQYIQDDTKRVAFLKYSLFLFGIYYFPHFFTSKSAPFHKKRCKDFLSDSNIMLVAFRESAKTVWTMIYLIYSIVYKKHNFVLFYSYEQRLAASRLFDIIVQLKTNRRLIRDFWHLFPDNSTSKEDWLQKKSVSEFITSNGIKFKAMSIGMSSRWQLFVNKEWAYRPDCVCLDDIDVIESVRNPEIVNKNIEFMENELFGWLDSEAKIIFLGNIITNIWLVPYFENKIKSDPKWIINRQPIIENNEITWDRFVLTDKEREERADKWVKKISLETKKREQTTQYEPNFLLIPSIRLGNPVFNHDIVHTLIEPEYTIDGRYKELKLYKQPTKDIVFGVDSTGGGEWWDYATIVARTRKKELVLSFQGKYAPDQLATVLEYIFSLGYTGKIVPESNSIGIATIDKLKQWPCKMFLYAEKSVDKITQRPTNKYWFNTNSKTKPILINGLEEDIRNGVLKEIDIREKLELLNYYYDEKWATNALVWHNDDLVIADALCLFGISKTQQFTFV